MSALLIIAIVLLLVAAFGGQRVIEYERIDAAPYRHQVTVTDYPPRVLMMLGLGPDVRVFVNERLTSGYEDCGWYEIPGFKELSCVGHLSSLIKRSIRQQLFVEAGIR